MELSLKSKTIKRRSKKKKIKIPDCAIVPLIKPDACDGISNWIRMQKIINSDKEEELNKKSKKMLKSAENNLNSKGDASALRQRNNGIFVKSAVIYPSKKSVLLKGSDQSKPSYKCLNETDMELESGASKKNENQSHEFNFNGSTKDSNYESKSNKYAEKKLTKAVAMDCEMVGTGPKGEESIIARVSIVNAYGVCLYDEFVKPKEKVTDYRTQISGVRPSDLKKGKDLFEVQKDVLNIIEGRILVGHSIKHDLDVLFMSHPRHLIRDTAHYKPFRDICGGKTPSLKKLTSKILGCDIQSGEHSSVEDAHATMLLYLRQREEWETQIEDAQATMLLYLRQKREWEKEVRFQRRGRKPKIITNETEN